MRPPFLTSCMHTFVLATALSLALLAHAQVEGDPGTAASAPKIVRYALCAGNVALTEIVPQGGQFGVMVQLSRAGTREVEELTRQHLGETLEVVFDGVIFVTGPIQRPLRSGLFAGLFPRKEIADGALSELRKRLESSECGNPVPASPPGSSASRDRSVG